ncbi:MULTISPECIES: glycerol-3-phosphate dehydrogenase subunit GlpB [Sanguibacteroides]|uniref:Glycerol-3-phosphate dehydrogenase n=1 Tax=Sanguibacteroides justesenii TaxID=1547597 RepID=A0A0C3NER6_9PORP|nr:MULTISPECIES: glycerol-3-phosphate dehydrogenase subunit GlpB [Sanguibacteroides]KIO44622.1 glycerol-3-phosphate dehydrogenase [Sanguibacteroides justesenii]KIO46351.1 glycerol-3-phosphate dehydrogenase [Sanguibacteroides justesenii]PXZ43411.1 glycerol-3-phosphate dehydrogenase subunit GlpB [Sanguibacteroides justesenii]
MKFDTVIIGGGLSGLICGIYLSKRGQRCVIISSGQSALHFSSGSFDLLNALPDGTGVNHPLEAVEELILQAPEHPYAKLGVEKFATLAAKAKSFLEEAGVPVSGDERKNHYRITPMGTMKPTWLTLKEQLMSAEKDRLPWKKIAVFNVTGFLDFYTQFLVDEFCKMGTECRVHLIHFPALENLRKNPTEMRSVNIARVFDHPENLDELIRILREKSVDCEAVVLPAILGLGRDNVLDYVQNEIKKPVRLVSTLPPSVPGIRAQQRLCRSFQQAGGVYMPGDTVLKADREGRRITRLYSADHGDIPFVGQQVVLATGSYFSQGLIAEPDRIYEPVFDLDVSYLKDREQWYRHNVFEVQPYQSFGVKTNTDFRGMYRGEPLDNLYVAGAVLEGYNAMKEGCGAGVSILSALYVAERILSK